MSFDGPGDDPATRPMPQGTPPSPYTRPGAPVPGDPARPPATAPYEPAVTARYPVPAPGGPAPGWGGGPSTQVLGHGPAAGGPPPGRAPRPGRRGLRSPAVLIPAVLGVVVVLGAVAAFAVVRLRGPQMEAAPTGTPTVSGKAAALPAGRTWLSGIWTGGGVAGARANAFGTWRGQPADVVTTYPAYDTWDQLRTSDWHVSTLDGFTGRVSYGLPLLPKHDAGSLADVAAGKYDDVFAAVAAVLNKHGRTDAFVRIGLEANGTWFPWGANAGTAADYVQAWRHVQSVLKAASPHLSFGFDITCGKGLEGGGGRMDPLNKLYPGDDVVDVVGCDHYDSYTVKSRNADEWKSTLRPSTGPGLADVADFARAHHKQLAVPEWGLTSTAHSGAGDDPFFIYSMYQYFLQNKDVLAYENYFNEPDESLGSAIWDAPTNPLSAAEYKKLWGAPPHLSTTATPAG